MKNRYSFSEIKPLANTVLIAMLFMGAITHAQDADKRYEVRPGDAISMELETLEVVYVLEAVLDEVAETLELTVYPNPTIAELNVATSNKSAISELYLYTMSGARVPVRQMAGTTFNATYDVARLPSGMYIAVVQLENGKQISKKIIKN